jgi:transcriptional regulator with XRE-family HTH domain
MITSTEDFTSQLLRLRGRTGLTQSQLAARVGVHTRSIQAWEAGLSTPNTERLQALIMALLSAGGFAASREAAEARAFWDAADLQTVRQHPPFDAQWFSALEALYTTNAGSATSAPAPEPNASAARATPVADWGDAPDNSGFVSRQDEVDRLRDWLSQERTRVVFIRGMGGIGKTRLAARVAFEAASQFDRVHWRSLRYGPTFAEWSASAIAILGGPADSIPEGESARIDRLMELMSERRCLLVLDKLELLLEPGQHDGRFHPEHASFARFLCAAGERRHQSCVIVTSREIPQDMPLSGITVLEVAGLDSEEAQRLLGDLNLQGTPLEWQQLVARYGGNPYALRVVGHAIREVFGGNIAEFGAVVPLGMMLTPVRSMLESQYKRLSPIECAVVGVLANATETCTFVDILSELTPRVRQADLLEAIEGLRHRSLVECSNDRRLRLQSVVWEYVLDSSPAVAA